jgi:hypothetical protein
LDRRWRGGAVSTIGVAALLLIIAPWLYAWHDITDEIVGAVCASTRHTARPKATPAGSAQFKRMAYLFDNRGHARAD